MTSQDTSASKNQTVDASRSITSSKLPWPSYPTTPAPKSRPKSYRWHLCSQLLSLLWLGPIITLLVLNFRNHVIGASIWCPFGRCFSDAFGDDAIATAVRLDKWDHDVLASLQFVAQAFEIWFLMIATALLYDVGMFFARRYAIPTAISSPPCVHGRLEMDMAGGKYAPSACRLIYFPNYLRPLRRRCLLTAMNFLVQAGSQ